MKKWVSLYWHEEFIWKACAVCAYDELQRATEEHWFDDPEWPLILEQNCGT